MVNPSALFSLIRNTRLKIAIILATIKQHAEAQLSVFEGFFTAISD